MRARSRPALAVRRLRNAVASADLSPGVWLELVRERTGGHVALPEHEPHLHAALDWLARAQDGSSDDGFARGYSLSRTGYFRLHGWQPSYPETTGYIIPTLYLAAELHGRADLAVRAERAARWLTTVQLDSGAVPGGVVGEAPDPAVFNTGQVLFGWLSAYHATGDEAFARAAARAAAWLCSVQGADGLWHSGNSIHARDDATLYNARVAWGLAETGVRLRRGDFVDAAARNLRAVAAVQRPNGWFPNSCLTDPSRPLLHTIAYTIRGLLEGGRVLQDPLLVAAAERAARPLAEGIREDGWLAGRFDAGWRPAVRWSCLTGEVQMASIWLNLSRLTGESSWIEPARAAIRYVKATQNRSTRERGLRGGIRGSRPITGAYGRMQVLNWATKFFADALMRDDLTSTPGRFRSPHLELA